MGAFYVMRVGKLARLEVFFSTYGGSSYRDSTVSSKVQHHSTCAIARVGTGKNNGQASSNYR